AKARGHLVRARAFREQQSAREQGPQQGPARSRIEVEVLAERMHVDPRCGGSQTRERSPRAIMKGFCVEPEVLLIRDQSADLAAAPRSGLRFGIRASIGSVHVRPPYPVGAVTWCDAA